MEKQRGQIALIIILIMTVLLTVGASLASQSINDVVSSRQGEQGNKTLQAAEAGAEDALANISTYLPSGQDSRIFDGIQVGSITPKLRIDRLHVVETRVDEGGTVTVDLTGAVGALGGNSINIDWGKIGSCPDTGNPMSSLLMTVINGTSSQTQRQYAVAALNCGNANEFPTTGVIAAPDNYQNRYALPLQNDDQYVLIHVLRNDTMIRASGANFWSMPEQGYAIRSEATNVDGNNETSVVSVNRTPPGYPSIFNYVLYAGGASGVLQK